MSAPHVPPELQQTGTMALFFQKLLDYIPSVAAGAQPGTVQMFAGASIPSGWLECDGSAVSRTTYAGLFSAISTTWGVGDGSTTFNLPDLRGRVPIGVGTGVGLTARTLADTGGEEAHALTEAELAQHNHAAASGSFAVTGSGLSSTTGTADLGSEANTANAGSGTAHENMPPFAAVKFMVKT